MWSLQKVSFHLETSSGLTDGVDALLQLQFHTFWKPRTETATYRTMNCIVSVHRRHRTSSPVKEVRESDSDKEKKYKYVWMTTNQQDTTGLPKKVSHYQVPSLNRIKNRQLD